MEAAVSRGSGALLLILVMGTIGLVFRQAYATALQSAGQ